MSRESFMALYENLCPSLEEHFDDGFHGRQRPPNGRISTKLRLSAALCFFAGATVYDILLTHGIDRASVYKSVYGVVNVVNSHPSLALNDDGKAFPSHDEQREIAHGFHKKSGAGFDKVILKVDGMLVWTIQPSKADCEAMNIGERMFHYHRKDKYGFLLLTGCNHLTRFCWAEICHLAVRSDYLAWTSSDLGSQLADNNINIILPGHTIISDSASVENMTIATPIPWYHLSPVEDGCNFYLSQLHITIERAFGILVHQLGNPSRPLSMSALKVPAMVTCLMRLHIYYVNADGSNTPGTMNVMVDGRHISGYADEATIQKLACSNFCASRCRRGQQA